MTVLERFVRSKTGNPEDCEDIIFVNERFAAVIDGATARTCALYDGVRPGKRAALLTQAAFEKLPEDADLSEVLECVTAEFAEYHRGNGTLPGDGGEVLTAAAALYSRRRRLVWLIGDCRCRVGELEYANPNGIDGFVAGVRSLVNQAELAKGRTEDWIMAHDPGAEFIRPLLTDQFFFQNRATERAGSFRYAAIDGRAIPVSLVRTVQLGEGDRELILSSDGYPVLGGTVSECERALAGLIAADPLCIHVNRGVKGLKPGFESYDDRAFLKLAL